MRRSRVSPTSSAFASMRRSARRLVGALLVGALPVALGACRGDAQLHGVMIDPPRALPTFEFTVPGGARWTTAAEAGRPMVVFFGYTHCPDVCPTTLADWKRAKQKLGRKADRVRFVFVTIDIERDTPAVSARYARQFDSTFVGVSGDSATTARIMGEFGVAAAREATSDPNYFMSHSAQSFLVDDRGRLVAMYPFGIGWDALAADLETLL